MVAILLYINYKTTDLIILPFSKGKKCIADWQSKLKWWWWWWCVCVCVWGGGGGGGEN